MFLGLICRLRKYVVSTKKIAYFVAVVEIEIVVVTCCCYQHPLIKWQCCHVMQYTTFKYKTRNPVQPMLSQVVVIIEVVVMADVTLGDTVVTVTLCGTELDDDE